MHYCDSTELVYVACCEVVKLKFWQLIAFELELSAEMS